MRKLERQADGLAPVGDEEEVLSSHLFAQPAAICSTISIRSSPRGSSSVITTCRSARAAASPCMGRFARSRSPADPKTAVILPLRRLSHPGQKPLESARGVRVVHDDGKRLAEVHALHPALDAAKVLDKRGKGERVDLQEPRNGEARGQGVLHPERPGYPDARRGLPASVSSSESRSRSCLPEMPAPQVSVTARA